MCCLPSASFEVKTTNLADEAMNYTAKQQTESDHLKGSRLSPQSSGGKIVRELTDKTLPLKPSSKLVSLKQKEEIAEKERAAHTSVSREKTASGKQQKTTPKKEKISPKKAEVGTIKIILVGLVEFAGKEFSFIIVCVTCNLVLFNLKV